MFSILQNEIPGARFLDMFSGSGIVGIEAASRGASFVQLVEKDPIKKSILLKNISIVESPIQLRLTSAEMFIRRNKEAFDIIHLDPPFPYKYKKEILKLVDKHSTLAEGGILMMHYPGEESYPTEIGSLKQYDLRKYGRSQLVFYRYGD